MIKNLMVFNRKTVSVLDAHIKKLQQVANKRRDIVEEKRKEIAKIKESIDLDLARASELSDHISVLTKLKNEIQGSFNISDEKPVQVKASEIKVKPTHSPKSCLSCVKADGVNSHECPVRLLLNSKKKCNCCEECEAACKRRSNNLHNVHPKNFT